MRASDFDCYLLITIAVSIFLPFVIHILLVRFFGLFSAPSSRQKGPIFSFGIGLGVLLAALMFWLASNGSSGLTSNLGPVIYSLGIYLLFSYAYFHFFNMSETARRIRILLESSRSPVLIKSDLDRTYTGEGMVKIRLERLVALGELKREGDRYYPGRGLLIIPALVICGFHKFLFPEEKN